MATNLFLMQSRARQWYKCDGCDGRIGKGSTYFRHDPLNLSPFKKEPTGHWCTDCIATSGAALDPSNGRLRVAVVKVLANRQDPTTRTDALRTAQPELSGLAVGRVELLGIGARLSPILEANETLIHALTPPQFQEFVCERLDAMGFEPRQVGDTYQRDGGIDILFWPRLGFPFLGAVQAKHHRDPGRKEGPSAVRDFAGVLSGHPINVGLLVTNTSFTADAKWFAQHKSPLLRLRDFADLQRWLAGNFSDAEEWREIPEALEVCPGLVVPIGSGRAR